MGRFAVGRDCVSEVVAVIWGDGSADVGIVECHWGVDVSVIGGDDVGVVVHWGVGLLEKSSSVGDLEDACQYALLSFGDVVPKPLALGSVVVVVVDSVIVVVVVRIVPIYPSSWEES
jgi:hypothetical protein